jgi:hypothetical protein
MFQSDRNEDEEEEEEEKICHNLLQSEQLGCFRHSECVIDVPQPNLDPI